MAIVDIGSNSVRLVSYEALTRSPTPTFNEKVLCGLGKGVATTGFLTDESIAKALAALQRFKVLCRTMRIEDIRAIATAAVRDAANGPQFLELAELAIGRKIELLDGQREAQLSALGVLCSIHEPDGVVGDLGGGSLELTDVNLGKVGRGMTLPLGGLSLMDISERSPKKAVRFVRETLSKAKPLDNLAGRTFYAVGGTWRALARLHMRQRQYPLNVMHNYVIPSRDALEFAKLVERIEADALLSIEFVSAARRPLLAYGAVVLEEIIRKSGPKEIVMSALGVREGILYQRLSQAERDQDPLLVVAQEFNVLRSRAPAHGEELFAWTSQLMKSSHLEETPYRGEQSLNLIANAAFIGVDHPGRAFLALAASYRHIAVDQEVGPHLRSLVSARLLDRARILGAAMRVAYIISAAMPGVLPRAPMICLRGKVLLTLAPDLASLNSDRLQNRLRQFARLIGGDPEIRAASAIAGAPPESQFVDAK
ncbi:MAG: exopolyphosphatase [Roseiarcus sp.]